MLQSATFAGGLKIKMKNATIAKYRATELDIIKIFQS